MNLQEINGLHKCTSVWTVKQTENEKALGVKCHAAQFETFEAAAMAARTMWNQGVYVLEIRSSRGNSEAIGAFVLEFYPTRSDDGDDELITKAQIQLHLFEQIQYAQNVEAAIQSQLAIRPATFLNGSTTDGIALRAIDSLHNNARDLQMWLDAVTDMSPADALAINRKHSFLRF